MIKNEQNEINKTKYQQRKAKAKFVKNVLTAVIIILAVLFFWYANDTRRTNASTQQSIQGVRDELKQLRDGFQKQFNGIDKKLLEQDKTIQGVKQAKAEQVKLQPLVKAPVQRSIVSGGVEQWRGLVAKYFPANQVDNALKIMTLESGGNANALSRTCDRGLMQINCIHARRVNGNLALLFDPDTNIKVAYLIWSNQGWRPWSTARVAGVI